MSRYAMSRYDIKETERRRNRLGTPTAIWRFQSGMLTLKEDEMMTGKTGWLSAQRIGVFAGGAVTAIIATRLLPPFVGQAAGPRRAAGAEREGNEAVGRERAAREGAGTIAAR
jgi:hypothetical protein